MGKEDRDDPYMAMSDFVAPKDSGIKDYVAMFAVSAGFGVEEAVKKYQNDHDDYKSIMLKAVADRFAQSAAERVHEIIRKDLWGYAKEEKMSVEDMLKVKYQGIRPAPGYPSQPDHTEKLTMWDLMNVKDEIDVELTENLAMLPAASVSGLYFGGKCSEYFSVGKITSDL